MENNETRIGHVGPQSTFGKIFFDHYGFTSTKDLSLYNKEIKFYKRTGMPSWESKQVEEKIPEQKQVEKEQKFQVKEQKTMAIKDYSNQLKIKYDSVSSNWDKLNIEQLEKIETFLGSFIKPIQTVTQTTKVKRKRKFKGWSKEVAQRREEYKHDKSNGFTGTYPEWLKIKTAKGTIFTNKL